MTVAETNNSTTELAVGHSSGLETLSSRMLKHLECIIDGTKELFMETTAVSLLAIGVDFSHFEDTTLLRMRRCDVAYLVINSVLSVPGRVRYGMREEWRRGTGGSGSHNILVKVSHYLTSLSSEQMQSTEQDDEIVLT